jgi:hypothetical protein
MKKNRTTPNPDASRAHPNPQVRSSVDDDTGTASAGTASPETLHSLLMAYAQTQDPLIVDQYAEKLSALLAVLRSRGFDADGLRKRLIKALCARDTGGYVNLACELAAASHFLQRFPEGFRYQVPSSEPAAGAGMAKNFDFSFIVDGFSFNVEVKAFAPKVGDHQGPPIKLFLPPTERKALYDQGARFSNNCAPAIARFLKDANAQLIPTSNGLSVMLLCCNDLNEYADALTCFVGPYGICNQTEQQGLVPAPAELPNVDVVVICQLGFSQNAVLDPVKLKSFFGDDGVNIAHGADAWDYARTLPVGLFLRKERPSYELQVAFGDAFRSHHARIFALMELNDGDAQQAVFSLFNTASSN